MVQAFVRNLFRAIEDVPIPSPIGMFLGMFLSGITIFLTSHRQRIGDLVAGTFVIDVRDADRAARQLIRGESIVD